MKTCPLTPHAISGIFWLGTIPTPSEEMFLISRKTSVPISFHGIIGIDGKSPYPDPEIMGEVVDIYSGNSAVLNLHLGQLGSFSFDRRYNAEQELRSFEFRKGDDSVFVGQWRTIDRGVTVYGGATCILTPLQKSFFEEPPLKVI